MEERLQKILAQAGVASRRHSEELIQNGKVKVNGKIVTELGTKVDAQRDRIEVNGKRIPAPEKKVYYLLHKPRGYVTTLQDDRGRKTVMDLMEGVEQRVFPVGRLDYDSEGLLILTNDGELTQALTHPRHKVKKTYQVTVEGIPAEEDLERMAKGLELEDGMTAPAEVKLVSIGEDRSSLMISIYEGRNRQVRRMCEYIGHQVLRLRRIRMGTLQLDKLKSGEMRPLTHRELREMMALVGLKPDFSEMQEPVKGGPRGKGRFNTTAKANPSGRKPSGGGRTGQKAGESRGKAPQGTQKKFSRPRSKNR